MSVSLIIGAGGQDGRLLSHHLKSKGETVLEMGRGWVRDLRGTESPVNLMNGTEVASLISETKPDRIFYLAAFHHSSSQKELKQDQEIWGRSISTHVEGWRNILEGVAIHRPQAALFYAASSLVFGSPERGSQNEESSLNPVCIYGITKTMGVHLSRFYRNEKGLRVNVGFLYTHESPLRGVAFVAKKIVTELKEVAAGIRKKVILGDLSAEVDWGYAPDFVTAMDLITQREQADDYIVATGEAHSVGEFAQVACQVLGLDFYAVVEEDPNRLVRKKRNLVGDGSKLRKLTGWKPSLTFVGMVQKLVRHEGA